MAARFGFPWLAVLVAACAVLAGAAPADPWRAAAPAPLRPDVAAGYSGGSPPGSAADPAEMRCVDFDPDDDIPAQDGPEARAGHAAAGLQPPSPSAAVFRGAGVPPCLEYHSRVFRPPAARAFPFRLEGERFNEPGPAGKRDPGLTNAMEDKR